MAEPADPRLRPLRIALGVAALVTLVVFVLAGLAGCHHAGWV